MCQEAGPGEAQSIPGCQDQLVDVAVLPTYTAPTWESPAHTLCLQSIKEPEDTARGGLVR